jgi:hypothetical protein
MATAKQTEVDPLEQFRGCLEDMVAVVDKVRTTCESTEDLLGVMKLALTNEGQLKLLYREVFGER